MQRPRTERNEPQSHPALAATLLMLGVLLFLVLIAVTGVMT
jgi:hypothetical protein